MRAPIPDTEDLRLEVLRSLEILDTEPEAIYDDVAELAAKICEAPIAAVTLIDASRQWLKARVGLDVRETSREIAFCAYTILDEEPLIVCDATDDPRFSDNPLVVGDPKIRFYAGVPLRLEGQGVGSLCVLDTKPRKLSGDALRALRILARHVTTMLEQRVLRKKEASLTERLLISQEEFRRQNEALLNSESKLREYAQELERANMRLEALATTDGLTGLLNHRAFQERIGAEMARAARAGSAVSVLMLDVDFFKRLNDAFGHQMGDEVLRGLAAILRQEVRPIDMVARYGGEEFVIGLPDTDSEQAAIVAERCRASVDEWESPAGRLTMSIGYATSPPYSSKAELLAAADAALYESKRNGRNRVTMALAGGAGQGL